MASKSDDKDLRRFLDEAVTVINRAREQARNAATREELNQIIVDACTKLSGKPRSVRVMVALQLLMRQVLELEQRSSHKRRLN